MRTRSPAAPATNITPEREGRSKRCSVRPTRAGIKTVIRCKSMVALRESSGWAKSMETGPGVRSQSVGTCTSKVGCPVIGCRNWAIPALDAKGSQDGQFIGMQMGIVIRNNVIRT